MPRYMWKKRTTLRNCARCHRSGHLKCFTGRVKEVHSLGSLVGHLDSERHGNVWNQLIVQQLLRLLATTKDIRAQG